MNFKIREAVKSDIKILAKNNQTLANETENIHLNLDTIISGVSNALDREDCHYFVAEINKMVVGQTLITYEWSDWRNGLIWWIQSVFVLFNFRKQGVFRALFNHIENLFLAIKVIKVSLRNISSRCEVLNITSNWSIKRTRHLNLDHY